MIKTETKISDICDQYGRGEIIISNMTFGDDDTSITVRGNEIVDTLMNNYSEWVVMLKTPESGVMPLGSPFERLWTHFISTHKRSYDRVAVALYTDYSPIDNYDRHSEITVKNPLVETEVTMGARHSEDNIPIHRVTTKETAYTNLTGNEASSTETAAYKDEHDTNSVTDTTSVKAHNVTTEDYTHGNIGVEKSSNIAKEEILFRLGYSLADIIVGDFITRYCYLWEE